MHMRYTVAAFVAAGLVVTVAGNTAAQSAHEIRKGTMVNITTCVIPSLDEDDEFVLTNIVDSPVHPPIAGKVIYWVKEPKKIGPYVGKRIQFDARIDDVDRREVEVKRSSLNGNGNGAIVEIELAGNEVKASPDTVGLSSVTPPVDDDDEISIRTTTVELDKLTNIRVVGGNCNTGMSTATVAAATTELTTETRTTAETASAVGIEAFTDVPRTEPAAVVETPSVAVTRETEVAVETAPMPLPEVSVESPAPTLTGEIESTRTELPATATPLPLIGLLGFASLGTAAAMRLRRR